MAEESIYEQIVSAFLNEIRNSEKGEKLDIEILSTALLSDQIKKEEIIISMKLEKKNEDQTD